MAFTSQQKHYIKKNLGKLSIEELAANLNLSSQQVEKFVEKHYGQDKYLKITGKHNPINQRNPQTVDHAARMFKFKEFLAENINYFILFFILVFLCYFNTLGNDFVSDDIQPILKNPDIGSLKYTFGVIMGLPQRIIHFLAFHIGGLTPGYFRIFNLLFHLGSTFTIFIILNLLTKKNIAIFSSLLFAVHPILTEAVTWISGMPYAMYSFFFLISFLLYLLSEKNWKIYFYSLAFFILALLSSEKSVVLFIVILFWELSFGNWKLVWKKLIPFASLSFILGLIFVGKIGQRVTAVESMHYQPSSGSGLENPLLQVPIAIGSYLKLIFWPQNLSLYQTEMQFSTGQYIVYLFMLIILLSLIFYSWKRNRAVFFWLSFFIITLLPTLTPLKISWIVAERYAYLGSLGIFVAIAIFLDRIVFWLSEKDEKYKLAAYSLFAVIILAFSIRTIIRNTDWKNEDTLWIATAKVAPSGQNIHNNLGDVYARQGDLEEAVEEFKKAIGINPNYADAYHNLANTYQQMGKKDLAIENYQKALDINPTIWQSYQNLASIHFSQNDYAKAQENIKKALSIDPNNQNLKENLQLIEEKMN